MQSFLKAQGKLPWLIIKVLYDGFGMVYVNIGSFTLHGGSDPLALQRIFC